MLLNQSDARRLERYLPGSNLHRVYFSLAMFQLVSCSLSLAISWQNTYAHKLPKLCSVTLTINCVAGAWK